MFLLSPCRSPRASLFFPSRRVMNHPCSSPVIAWRTTPLFVRGCTAEREAWQLFVSGQQSGARGSAAPNRLHIRRDHPSGREFMRGLLAPPVKPRGERKCARTRATRTPGRKEHRVLEEDRRNRNVLPYLTGSALPVLHCAAGAAMALPDGFARRSALVGAPGCVLGAL